MHASIIDVAIVGGGPVGLTLALSLSRAGHRVVLFEAETELAKEQRGAAFHPPTLEMLDALGIAGKILPIGVKVPVWQIRNRTGLIAEFDLSLLKDDTRYPFRFHLPQHLLSTALVSALHADGIDVRFGHRVQSIEETADAACVRFVDSRGHEDSVRARFVVGADGAHSVVRKHAGIAFEGFSWPERFLVTNIAYPLDDIGFSGTAYVSDPVKWAVVIKLADPQYRDLWRVAYPVDADLPDDAVLGPEAVQASLAEVLPQVRVRFPVVYSNTYRVHQRVASTFHRGRLLLAGDAAHINNPLGGFGLNGGIHDAVSLAEALHGVLCAPVSDAPLQRYARQRRHVAVEHVQAQSIRNKRQIEERDPAARAFQAGELMAIAADPRRAHGYLLDTSMISSIRRAAEVV